MKLLVQWSTESPLDWFEVDSADWPQLVADHKKPVPVLGKGKETLDQTKGWICGISVQGNRFDADHYAIEELDEGSGGIRVTIWSDDPEDIANGEYRARVFEIKPLAPDQ